MVISGTFRQEQKRKQANTRANNHVRCL